MGPNLGRGLTDHRQVFLRGREDVLQDEQEDGDGQQDGDLEAQLLPPAVADEEGGQVQDQQVEEGHHEDDHVEQGLPVHDDLEEASDVSSNVSSAVAASGVSPRRRRRYE